MSRSKREGLTEVVGDTICSSNTWLVGVRILIDFAILDIEAADFPEVAVGGAVGGNELGYNGDLGLGIDGLENDGKYK